MSRFVVCYDIADGRRRRKVAACLDSYGDRVQESVFEMLVDNSLFDNCMADLAALIEMNEDNVVVYRLCGACNRERTYIGLGRNTANIGEEEVYVV